MPKKKLSNREANESSDSLKKHIRSAGKEIAEMKEEVFNPFSKQTFECKIIDVERKGESATAQAWFPIDSGFTVLLAVEKKSLEEKWKVIGFPTK